MLDEWTIRTLAPCTSYGKNPEDFEESVMYCDNLKTQTKPEWISLLWKHCRMKLHLFPSGVTDEVQTIDDGHHGFANSEATAKLVDKNSFVFIYP